MPVVRPFTTPDRMRTSSASTRAVDSPSPLARRLSIRAARAAGSTGTPAAIPSSTAPHPRAVGSRRRWSGRGRTQRCSSCRSLQPSRARRLFHRDRLGPPAAQPRHLDQGDPAALGLFVVEHLGVDFFLVKAGPGRAAPPPGGGRPPASACAGPCSRSWAASPGPRTRRGTGRSCGGP